MKTRFDRVVSAREIRPAIDKKKKAWEAPLELVPVMASCAALTTSCNPIMETKAVALG